MTLTAFVFASKVHVVITNNQLNVLISLFGGI